MGQSWSTLYPDPREAAEEREDDGGFSLSPVVQVPDLSQLSPLFLRGQDGDSEVRGLGRRNE